MVTVARPLTPHDLLDTPDDGQRYEIIGGELIVSPAPIPEHQRLLTRLHLLFATFVNAHRLGEVFLAPLDVFLSEHDLVQPDLFFIACERLAIIGPRRIEEAPDLVLEVLSPSTRQVDQVRKAALYATAGVREYWLVDPEARAITVFRLHGQHFEPIPQPPGVAQSHVLTGLEIDVVALFAGLD
jgi:Uma2 family endonuclease